MAFFYQMKKYPLRSLKTCLMGFIFIGLGMFIAAPGPALLDLQLLANTSIEEVAYILPARSFGYAIGSVLAGIAGDQIDQQITLTASLIASVISIFFFPMFRSIICMYIFMTLAGIANGTLDTICNVWLIHLWGKHSAPFMQVVHFMYGLGAFITPFIVEKFLLIKEDEPVNKPVLLSDNNFTTLITNQSSSSSAAQLTGSNDVVIQWPFYIIALFYLAMTIAFVTVYIIYPDNTIHPSRLASENDDEKKDPFKLNEVLSKGLTMIVIIISTLSMHAYVGLEISFGSLLSPFAVKSDLKMTKSEGSYLTSGYWFTYTFFRVFSLIAIIYLSPRFLLLVNFGIIMFSNVFLLPFGNVYRWALWTGSALMGLGCSSVFATMFSFLEQLTPVTARITAGFMIAACAGEFIIPALVAAFIETKPQVFLWVVFSYSSVSFIGVLILIFIQHYLLKKQEFKKIEFKMRSNGLERY